MCRKNACGAALPSASSCSRLISEKTLLSDPERAQDANAKEKLEAVPGEGIVVNFPYRPPAPHSDWIP
jgi:hypothetical protein